MAGLRSSDAGSGDETPREVVAVCISSGGVPKRRVTSAQVTGDGLVGDGHAHQKHCRPHRAVSIQDLELLDELRAEGYPVGPGIMGENVTVRGLNVQQLAPGDRLRFENGPTVELTEPRKPCFVLDAIDPALQVAVVGRCGFLGSVVRTGRLFPGQHIVVEVDGKESRPPKQP
jgi:MOSC domain-containing protein YiiM